MSNGDMGGFGMFDHAFYSSLFERVGIGIGVVDPDGYYCKVNHIWADMLGYTQEELLTKSIRDISHPSDSDKSYDSLRAMLRGDISVYRFEKRYIRKNHSEFTGELIATPYRNDSGKITGVIGVISDITEKKVLENQLLSMKDLYAGSVKVHQTLLHPNSLAFLLDEVCQIGVSYGGFVAAMVAELEPGTQSLHIRTTSCPDPEIKKILDVLELSSDPLSPAGIGTVGESVRSGKPVFINDYLSHPHTALWRERAKESNVRSVASFPLKKMGEIIGTLIVLSDKVGYFQAEILTLLTSMSESISYCLDSMEYQERLLLASTVFMEAIEGVVIMDRSGALLMANKSFYEITGYLPADIMGKNIRMFRSDLHDSKSFKSISRDLVISGKWEGEIWNRRKDGTVRLQRLLMTGVRQKDGLITHYIGFLSDITAQREEEDRIRRLAFHDVLTGLPNRALFQDRLDQAMRSAKRSGYHLGICYLDLDGFKPINDRFGHQVGDELLKEIALRLSGVIRESDTVCRFGGDEFIVLFSNLFIAEEIKPLSLGVLQEISRPFIWEGETLSVTASAGLALYPGDADRSDALLTQADWAMYQAKKSGRNQIFWKVPN